MPRRVFPKLNPFSAANYSKNMHPARRNRKEEGNKSNQSSLVFSQHFHTQLCLMCNVYKSVRNITIIKRYVEYVTKRKEYRDHRAETREYKSENIEFIDAYIYEKNQKTRSTCRETLNPLSVYLSAVVKRSLVCSRYYARHSYVPRINHSL